MARVSLNKPDKMNAMTLATVDEMFRAFYDASHDASIGVIVVAGRGKHFGAGGDVVWERWGLREAFYNRYPHNRLIRMSRKPVIAQVQGYCIGGHNHMAYCCDFTIAADNAVFGQAGPRVSSPADGYFVPYLTKVVGAKKARELWMLCRKYKAEQALQMGLVNTVVPHRPAGGRGGEVVRGAAVGEPGLPRDPEGRVRPGDGRLQGIRARSRLRMYPDWFDMPEGKEGGAAFAEKRPGRSSGTSARARPKCTGSCWRNTRPSRTKDKDAR
ncbi:MAG: enoyl-CoA hydratase-related protein [Steroidobacteraceae bacterium]